MASVREVVTVHEVDEFDEFDEFDEVGTVYEVVGTEGVVVIHSVSSYIV